MRPSPAGWPPAPIDVASRQRPTLIDFISKLKKEMK
jgi:hypothetical protein